MEQESRILEDNRKNDIKQKKECSDAIIQNLKDAGCSEEKIACFVECFQCENTKKELALLIKHRKELLDCVHENQKRIDCLDYLIYQLKKKL